MRRSSLLSSMALACGVAALGCSDEQSYDLGPITPVGPPITGLHVVGNHLEDATGDTVNLRGVNRSGTEYSCTGGGSVFDGAWGIPSVRAISTWNANAVRIPLNESCWLGINGAPAAASGATYKSDIKLFVSELHQFHIVPIVELHWVGPGTSLANTQQPMPDADNAVNFWTDVATTFAGDDGVVFELYNEPFPDSNHDTDAAWQCWRDGCVAPMAIAGMAPSGTYMAVGFQALVNAVRATGAKNLILLGGVEYSNALTQWLAYQPTDSASNLAAAWHIYSNNACNNQTCWDAAPATLAAQLPIVATEIGESDCAGGFIGPLMQWLDMHSSNYLAWSWNDYGACAPYVSQTSQGHPWALVTDYDSGTPNGGYAQAFHDHVLAVTTPASP